MKVFPWIVILLSGAGWCSAATHAGATSSGPGTQPSTQPSASFYVASLMELRVGGPERPPRVDSNLSVLLRVELVRPAEFHSVESIRIDQAVDDTGHKLAVDDFSSPEARSAPILPHGTIRLPPLFAPSRKATELNVLRGEVLFKVGGQKHTATVSNIKSSVGKMIRVNLNGQELDLLPMLNGQMLTLSLRQSKMPGLEAALVSGDGSVIGRRPFAPLPFAGGGAFNQFRLPKPLDDSMNVEISAWSDEQTVHVPFDLRNIPLP